MTLHKTSILLSLGICLMICSCKKYVEVQPKGKITPTAVSDYQLLLNNTSIWNLSIGTSDFLTDDIALTDPSLIASIASTADYNIYQFSDYFYQSSQNDPEWNLFYQQIYTANVIIDGLSTATGGTDAQKQEMTAEAKTHRAYAYLCLVNLYAKQYDGSAAASPGVPMLLTPSYTQNLARATVAAVYAQIFTDLNSALPALAALPPNKAAPSQAAVYALLARTYLYSGDYANALANAVKSLALQSTLLNLNSYSAAGPYPGFALPLAQNNPEVIFLKASEDQDPPQGLSADLLQLLGTNDLRYTFYTYNGPDIGYYNGRYYAYFAPNEPRNEGPTVGEMILIQAECLARTGHGQDGLTAVNALRKVRFTPANYTALTAANDAAALTLILQERRKELFGRAFRLFDLKRLNSDPAYAKTVTHVLGAQTFSLAPGGNKYVYPIPQNVIGMNPKIVQNPR